MKKIYYILILIFLINCSQKKDNSLEYEKTVMIQLFPSLVDSIFSDIRTSILPIEPYIKKGTSDSLKNEKIKKYQILIAEREKRIIEIKNDTSRIVIAVFDTIKTRSLLKGYEAIKKNDIEYVFDSITKKIEYKIDLAKLTESNKFIFKYLSEFPQDKTIFRKKYPFYFGGVVSFTRIQFDKDKKHGTLTAAISYGVMDSQGFDIYIKKDETDKWVIDRIKGTWIS